MRWVGLSAAVVLVTCACGSGAIDGDPTARVENQYRNRVIDQLDLPLPHYANWEVVDAVDRPDPQRPLDRLGSVSPETCGPDGTVGSALWDAFDVGERWTAAHGTGPAGEEFDVAVTSTGPDSEDAVAEFLQRCGTTTFTGATGTVTVTAAPLPALPEAAFGLTLSIADGTPAALEVSYVVAQPETLRLVLTYSTTGAHAVEEIWERALERFDQPR